MKQAIILLIMLLSVLKSVAQLGRLPENPKILIYSIVATSGSNIKESNKFLENFENIVQGTLKKEVPCAEIITRNNIKDMLLYDRQEVLLGREGNFKEITDGLKCDILIPLYIIVEGENYFLSGSTLSTRHSKASGRYNGRSDNDNKFKEMQKFANDLVRDLLINQICAYKGEFTYKSTKTFNETVVNNGLPGIDCEFKKTMESDDKTEEIWTFQKVNRSQAEVQVNTSMTNIESVSEHNTCNHCQLQEGDYLLDQFEPNRANMNFSTVITETYSATKIANIYPEDKFEKYHGMMWIEFNTLANSYTIHVKAFSEPGLWNKKTENNESGCPYHKNTVSEEGGKYATSINCSFGPFLGSPYQKNLKQTVTKTFVDPDSKGNGKTVETVSFNLTRQ